MVFVAAGGASTQIIFRPPNEVGGDGVDSPRVSSEASTMAGFQMPDTFSPDDFWSASHLGYGVAEVGWATRGVENFWSRSV